MTTPSHEVVRRAIEFDNPPRLPVRFEELGVSDIYDLRWNYIGTGNEQLRQTVDEWGCIWVRTEKENMGQVKGHPLSDWSAVDQYKWPDPNQSSFYTGLERKMEKTNDRYVLTSIFMLLFERLQALRGFENVLIDLYMERERIEKIADRIVEFDIGIIQNISSMFPGMVHGITFTEDWGTQQGLIINPKLWKNFFKPRYKLIFDAIHAAGWHAWMHSCGKVNDIIGELIEIGLDVINLQQPRALGIEEVGKKFAGRICFESLCDIQHTLPFKNEIEIKEEAQLIIKSWSTEQGGFILSDYGQGAAIGVPSEKKRIMYNAFQEVDRWRDHK
jgi:hypothetical protein